MNSRETQLEQIGSGNVSSAGGFQFNQQTTELCKAAAANGPTCGTATKGNEYNSFASFLLGVVNSGGKIYQPAPNYFSDTNNKYSFARLRARSMASQFKVYHEYRTAL